MVTDSGRPEPTIEGLSLVPVAALPPESLRYLLASRYCEVDRMTAIAWDLFGKTPETWERVQTVMDWVHKNVTFGYQYSRPTKTAFDVFTERQGVCRDFQHLAITILRALNFPPATPPATWATSACRRIRIPWTSRPGSRSTWATAGTPWTPGTTSPASAAC